MQLSDTNLKEAEFMKCIERGLGMSKDEQKAMISAFADDVIMKEVEFRRLNRITKLYKLKQVFREDGFMDELEDARNGVE